MRLKIKYLGKTRAFTSRCYQWGPKAYGGVLLLLMTTTVEAQLINTQGIVDRIEPVIRQVERVAEPLERRVNDIAADTQKTVGDVDAVSSLSSLPSLLPVVDLNGTTAFVDMEVEDGWRAVQYQWLVMLEPGELALVQTLPIDILEQTSFEDLGLTLLRFRVEDALDSREALQQVLPPALVDRFDRNHIYNPQAKTNSQSQDRLKSQAVCEQAVKLGMVDTAIQTDHPAFANSQLVEESFLGAAFEEPDAHGTAVAGLLVGAEDSTPPRLPGATLFNASVFYARDQFAQGATMMHLLKGLNWLQSQNVSVINMSLAGPDNKILAAAIKKIIATGTLVVAAAGNEGPAAPPLFPAAYTDVISATAVDSEQHIYRWANRGAYVDFAALGVSVLTARSGGTFGRESGTSMAAPLVSAFVACELANGGNREEVIERLANKAVDLGEQGRDPVFGFGLLR